MMSLLPMMYDLNQTDSLQEDLKEVYELDFNNTSRHSSQARYFQDEEYVYSSAPICTNSSSIDRIEDIENISFWIEGVFQLIVGIFGVIVNLAVIPILCNASMKSRFNRLLACLLVLHTIYICLSFTFYFGRTAIMGASGGWFTVFFSYVLYPLGPLILHSTTFFTVLMARQRYLAIRHPIEYRTSELNTNPSKHAATRLLLALITTAIFVSPLFFETSVERDNVGRIVSINETHFQYVSESL